MSGGGTHVSRCLLFGLGKVFVKSKIYPLTVGGQWGTGLQFDD